MGMTIAKLETENYRRWRLVNLEFPESGAIIISGKNGVGKSGAGIDALIELLFRKGVTTKTPIREGAERATIKVILKEGGEFEYGDLDCKVELLDPEDRSKRRLTVKGKKGAKYGATTLSGLFGDLTVDPSNFIRMLSRQRRDELLKAVTGLDIDLEENAAQRKAVFDDRTNINRDVVKLTGQIQGMDKPEEGLPDEIQSSNEILDDIDVLDSVIAGIDNLDKKIENKLKEYEGLENSRQEALDLIAKIDGRMISANEELTSLNAEKDDLKSRDEIEVQRKSLKYDLDNLEQTNEKIRAAKKYAETVTELTETQKEADNLTNKIGAFDKAKLDALAKAVFPLPELSLDGDNVMFDGLPFDDACTSAQYKIVCAIAMAQNPDADFIFMRNGGVLDLDNLKGLNDYAVENKFQIFVEYVSDDPDNAPGIYIEEGVDELTNVEDEENET